MPDHRLHEMSYAEIGRLVASVEAERDTWRDLAERALKKVMAKFEPGGTAEDLQPPFSVRELIIDFDKARRA